MASRDMHSGSQVKILITPAVLAADPTPPAVDVSGYDKSEIVLNIGVGGITFTGSNKVDFVLTHSADGSVYTNVTDADIIGVTGITNGIIKSLVAAHAAAAVYRFGYIGSKKFLKFLPDFSGTHGTGTLIGANVFLDGAVNQPTPSQI